MLSLITPTHKPDYLVETYHSLRLQSLQDWEWVIVPNGKTAKIPEVITRDPRVRVIDGGRGLHNIGALKRLACDSASGHAFVELDHDDLLVPGRSLQCIAEQFEQGAGFVYSDTAVFRYSRNKAQTTFMPYTYSAQHGWQNYPISIYGRNLKATACFEITPRSLAEIFYSPDHVRCWSRKAYYEAGGHNPELPVCDDHELMIKTYISGAPFRHTGGCHYLYRMFDHNTVVMRNQQIQKLTRELKEEHTQALIQAWLTRHSYAKLDLTELIRTGWDADRHLLQGFGLDKYGHIVADSELQKLTGVQVREFMNEAYEALVPGGYLTITVPEVHSGMGYGDVEWKSHFSAMSMSPYTRSNCARQNGKIECRFQQINCLEVFPSAWHRDNGFKYLRFELVALKGQRHPGLQHI
jgi:glycosyltransferase involved in cell wall biosynthesis